MYNFIFCLFCGWFEGGTYTAQGSSIESKKINFYAMDTLTELYHSTVIYSRTLGPKLKGKIFSVFGMPL